MSNPRKSIHRLISKLAVSVGEYMQIQSHNDLFSHNCRSTSEILKTA